MHDCCRSRSLRAALRRDCVRSPKPFRKPWSRSPARPFLAGSCAICAARVFDDVVLCVGYLGEQIEAVVGDGSRFGTRVSYSFDGPRLLGYGRRIAAAAAAPR